MNTNKLKIAIFHNFLDNIGGAEYVDLILARELDADIYTTNIDAEKIRKMGFSIKNIYSIGSVPLNAPYRQEATYWRFRKFKAKKKYDLYIIAGDWAVGAAVNNKPNLWYVYSPIREIWDLHEYTRNNIVPFHTRMVFDLWVRMRRMLNKKDVREVNRIISISKNVQERIKKYLKKESTVVYPPTETAKYHSKKSKGYWLSVNRLITHKRIDLQLEAFKKMPEEKLIVVGSYEMSSHFRRYVSYLEEIKPKNVTILSWVSNKELIDLYAGCRGFITTSSDEDYGMTPVEAMASGKPVIAPNEGGYKETILHKKTGLLINKITSEKIVQAVQEINSALQNTPLKYSAACIQQARKFDTRRFMEQFKEEIQKSIQDAGCHE